MPVDRASVSTGLPRRPPLRRAWRHRPALLLLLGWMAGCDDSTSPTSCSSPDVGAISVSDGLKPTITWASDCEAHQVAVYDLGTGLPLWHIATDTRRIPKPVVYGVVPAGAKTLHTAEPLQTGTQYGVFVAVVVGRDTLATIGGFTP